MAKKQKMSAADNPLILEKAFGESRIGETFRGGVNACDLLHSRWIELSRCTFRDPRGQWKGKSLIDPPHCALINGCRDVVLRDCLFTSKRAIGDVANVYSDEAGQCRFVQLIRPRISAPIWRKRSDPDIGTDICVDGDGGTGTIIYGGGLQGKGARLLPYRVIGIHAGRVERDVTVPLAWKNTYRDIFQQPIPVVPAVILYRVRAKVVELDGSAYPGRPARHVGVVWFVDCEIGELYRDEATTDAPKFIRCKCEGGKVVRTAA